MLPVAKCCASAFMPAGSARSLACPCRLAESPAPPRPRRSGRILVVVELSGANDGLNTVVPYRDDAYYRARPRLGIRADKLRKIDDTFGFQSGMAGFERLYKDGRLAIVHGVGYDQPRSPIFPPWRTGTRGRPTAAPPTAGSAASPTAWIRAGTADYLVNIDSHQSLAVRARSHVPLVFDDPDKFLRTRRVRGGERAARRRHHRGTWAIRPSASCSRSPTARRMPSRACGRHAPSIARRSTTGWCTSGSTRWRR